MTKEIQQTMAEECLVLKSRRAARAITRRYNKILHPYGLQCTQISLLFFIAAGEHRSVTDLAARMAMERSTLTRNLKLLHGRVYTRPDRTGRARPHCFELTERGEGPVRETLPRWRDTQAQLRIELGEEGWYGAQFALQSVGNVG